MQDLLTVRPILFKDAISNASDCPQLGSSACNGDSGGGMVFEMNEGNQNKKAYHLRGLISLSVALHNQAKCDPTHYVVFTDVAKYLSFIKQATAA